MNWPALVATYNSDRDGDGVPTTKPGATSTTVGEDSDDSDPKKGAVPAPAPTGTGGTARR